LLVFFVVSFECSLSHSQILIDGLKSRVVVVDRPQRVVALTPALSELAAQLIDSDLSRMVGVVERSDFPVEVKKIQSVGAYHQFNLEKVLSLKPDLVLATADGNPKDRVLRLRELGVPVVVTQEKNLEDIGSTVLLVARSLGVFERGRQKVGAFENELNKLRKRFKSNVSPKVLLQLGDDPLIVGGSASFLNDCLIRVGARNVYSDAPLGYPHPSMEDVLSRNPDVIVILTFEDDTRRSEEMLKKWLRFKDLNAVKNGRVRLLSSDQLLRPTPRIVEGLNQLAQIIYGTQN
jgi:iron complex transport system substrate-binding protein